MRKKIISCILVLCMLLTMMPTMAWAEPVAASGTDLGAPAASPTDVTLYIDDGSIVITATGYKQGDAVDETAYTGDYVITQTGTDTLANYIHITGGTHNITINNVNLNGNVDDSDNKKDKGPFFIDGNATVTLTLVGQNSMTGTDKIKSAAVEVVSGSALTIKGDGTLIAASGDSECAGIGGSRWRNAGSITILSGTIDAKCSGAYASGIGPGRLCTAESITISGGIIKNRCGNSSDRYNFPLGASSGKKVTTLTITGGVIDTNGIAGETVNISSGTIMTNKATPVEYTTLSVTGGNIIATSGLPATDSNSRKLAKLYVVDANGNYQKDTEVAVTVDSATPWKAITDSNGFITTYMLDNELVNGKEKLPDGWLIGGTCVCDTAPLTFEDTVDMVDVYSAEKAIDVVVRGECKMPIHQNVTMTVKIDSVTLENGTKVEKSSVADYAVYDSDAKQLTLKPAGNTDNYTVKLYALRSIEDDLVYHEIKVWASNTVGRKLDVANGPITVEEASEAGKVTYKQGDNEFTVAAADKVTITGTYELSAGNAIKIENCSPTIVLKDMTIESKANVDKDAESTILVDGSAADEVKLILRGTNTIIRGDSTNSGQKIGKYNGIEIRNATLTIDCECENGADCKDTACADKLIVTLGNGRSAAIGSRFESDWATNGEPKGYTLNIEGGQIEATTENFGAAIGTSWISGNTQTNAVNININDGYVKAVASDLGVAIGSGRSNNEPEDGVVNVNITGGEVEAVSISVKHRNDQGKSNSTSYAINASNVTISGDADTTVKGVARMKTIEIKDNASLDMQKKEGWTEDHGLNPGGSIGNGAEWVDSTTGETVVRAGYTKVIVSGNASLVTDGGIDGSLSTSGNATAEIKGVAPRSGAASTDKNVGGVSGTVNVGAGSTGSVTEEIKGTVTVEGGATINGTTLPEDAGTVTIPADKVDEVTVDENGTVSLPAGSTVTKDGETTTLTEGGTIAADGTVTDPTVTPETPPAGGDDPVDPPAGDEGGEPTPTPPYSGYYPSYVPSVTPTTPSVDSSSLNNAALAVGSAIKNGSAEFTPVNGYTKDEILQLQKESKLRLGVEKKSGYDYDEKTLIDALIAKSGGAVSGVAVMYWEITPVLKLDNGTVVAYVTDTEKPITITIELSADMTKAAKDGKQIVVVRAHDGKAEFISGTLNAAKTKITFSSADFSTFAVVALNKTTSAQTFDAGIAMYVGMSVLAATGSAVVIGKKRRAK